MITAIELELYPVTELYAGAMLWPIERDTEVLTAWRSWVDTVPDEVTSLGRLLHLPPIPDIPEPFRGRDFVGVEAACLLDAEAGEDLVAAAACAGAGDRQLRHDASREPAGDTHGPARTSAGDQRRHGAHRRDLRDDPCGGAHGRCRRREGCAVTRDPPAGRGNWTRQNRTMVRSPPSTMGLSCSAWGSRRCRPRRLPCRPGWMRSPPRWSRGGASGRCWGGANRETAPASLFGPSLARLQQIKADVDPDNMLQSNHPLV